MAKPSGEGALEERIGAIIDDLYEGTLEDAAWTRAMLGVADLTSASSALLFAYNPQTGQVLRDENHRFDPAAVSEYRRHWSYQDCRLAPMLTVPTLEPMPEAGMNLLDWQASAFLNEFLLPIDAPHALPAWLFKTPQKTVTLSLQGTAKRGAFERADIERYRRILPHIRRALQIRDRLAGVQLRVDSLVQGFHHANFGIVILNWHSAIIDANIFAERVLRTTPRALRSSKPVSPLRVRLTESSVPWMKDDRAAWMLLLFDPLHRLQASVEGIARDFGLTPRESQVVALLAAGENPKSVARLLVVSHNTVRSQLSAVFRKTGTRSQAELVERIALSPASFLPSPPPKHHR